MKETNILLLLTTFISVYIFYCNTSSFYCGLQEGVENEFKIKKEDLHIFHSVQELKEYTKKKKNNNKKINNKNNAGFNSKNIKILN